MNGTFSIEKIRSELNQVTEQLVQYCSSLSNEKFFYQPLDKWSAAQQVKHLIKATDTGRLAFSLPKFILRVVAGKPNRSSRTYDELVNKYQLKLEQGGKSSGRYIPKPIPFTYGKEKMLAEFARSMKKMENSLIAKWMDMQLDNYIAPHPLLGKITLRELCYFTIHHTLHHLSSIKRLTAN
jgi:hypothetical protein